MTPQEERLTAGELRRRLVELDSPWEVDPRLGDDDLVPDLPRGAAPPERGEAEAHLPEAPTGADLDAFLQEMPPADPDLRARWREAGLLEDEEAPS